MHKLLEEYGHVSHINCLLLRWWRWGGLFLRAVHGLLVTVFMLALLLQTCLFLLLGLLVHCLESFLLHLACKSTEVAVKYIKLWTLHSMMMSYRLMLWYTQN